MMMGSEKDALVPIPQNDGVLLIPRDILSTSLVVGKDDEGRSETVSVLAGVVT
jgi:hypothetical protein